MNKTYEETQLVGWFGPKEVVTECLKGWRIHKKDGPAVVTHNPSDGSISCKTWYLEGRLHRKDGAAHVCFVPGKVFPGDSRRTQDLPLSVVSGWRKYFINGKQVQRFK